MEPEPVPSDSKEASFFCATKDSPSKTGLNLAERTGFTKRHSAGTLPDGERTDASNCNLSDETIAGKHTSEAA
jgi:hypothetical protein